MRLVDAAKAFIADQLRVFTKQEHGSGKFVESHEYPEFPWFEGIINAVAHRDYAASGQFIKVSMYDDRLEIESPGRFPNIVTADNISYTRFSRNKTIARVMTEFEWVRELNEGVKKIYSDMAEAGLPAPEYIETPNTVKLILRNNIDERKAHRNKISAEILEGFEEIWSELDDVERRILWMLKKRGAIGRAEVAMSLEMADRTISRKINHLIELDAISINGRKYDKNHSYSLKEK